MAFQQQTKGKWIFVDWLPVEMTEDEIGELMSKYGELK